VSFEIVFFVVFGAIVAYSLYAIFRHGGFKGAMFGAKISSSIGEVSTKTRGVGSQKLKVHLLDVEDPTKPRVGIELTSSTPLSWNTVPIKLSDASVRELISLLEQSLGSPPPLEKPQSTMTFDSEVKLVIGRPAADHVRIRPVCRERPNSTDYWDGNWLDVEVAIQSGAFLGNYRANLRTDELASLLEGLVGLSNNLSGEAGLRSMEHWISLQLVGDGKGLFRVTGDVRDQPGTGNRLTFEFEIDQTEIAPIVRDLEAILSEFPVKGSPDS
jgi:hypothetical protein